MKAANLDPEYNLWFAVYDFNDESRTRQNWSYVSPTEEDALWCPPINGVSAVVQNCCPRVEIGSIPLPSQGGNPTGAIDTSLSNHINNCAPSYCLHTLGNGSGFESDIVTDTEANMKDPAFYFDCEEDETSLADDTTGIDIGASRHSQDREEMQNEVLNGASRLANSIMSFLRSTGCFLWSTSCQLYAKYIPYNVQVFLHDRIVARLAAWSVCFCER